MWCGVALYCSTLPDAQGAADQARRTRRYNYPRSASQLTLCSRFVCGSLAVSFPTVVAHSLSLTVPFLCALQTADGRPVSDIDPPGVDLDSGSKRKKGAKRTRANAAAAKQKKGRKRRGDDDDGDEEDEDEEEGEEEEEDGEEEDDAAMEEDEEEEKAPAPKRGRGTKHV